MKKLKYFIFILLCVISLSSCEQVTQTQIITKIEEEVEVTQIQNQITELYSKISKGCVGIYGTNSLASGIGSGVIFDNEGSKYYVVTNAHVVNGMNNFKVYLGQDKYVSATLVGYDKKNDVAVLTFSIDSSNITSDSLFVHDIFNYEDVDSLAVGQTVLAIGCPIDLKNFNVLTTGVLSYFDYKDVSHDAAINPGNSGGGLFNMSGRLIGINTSKETTATSTDGVVTVEGRGHAISLNVIKKCIIDILSYGSYIERPLLGISVVSFNIALNPEQYELYKMYLPAGSTRNGYVVVTDFANVSAAKNCGIEIGDVLISINDNEIYSTTIIEQVLGITNVDDIVKLSVYRSSSNSVLDINVKFK